MPRSLETEREPHLAAFHDHALRAGPEPVAARHATPRPAFVEESIVERLLRLRDDPRVATALIAVVALVAGVVFYRSALGSDADTTVVPTSDTTMVPTSTAPSEVVVHVSGAVASPGVYRLASGTRVQDAIDAAGGVVEGGEPDRLNLAALLGDGQRVHVPRVGEALPAGVVSVGAPSAESGPLNLNLATAEQLEALPGVGPALAQAILSERARRGGFRTINDLLNVRGIGEKRLADLRPLVAV